MLFFIFLGIVFFIFLLYVYGKFIFFMNIGYLVIVLKRILNYLLNLYEYFFMFM